MPIFALKLQLIIFFLLLQVVPLFSVPHPSQKTHRDGHFFLDFINFSDLFQDENVYLHELLDVMKDFAAGMIEDLRSNQMELIEKVDKTEATLASLRNKSDNLAYEIKYLTRHIYLLEDEIESNQNQLQKLLTSKQQIISMKVNESGLYHSKLKDLQSFSDDYNGLLLALSQSLQGFKALASEAVRSETKETLAEKRMSLGRIKARKKTMKSPALMNFLLLSEPFLAVAINSDLSHRDTVLKIVQKLEEMISDLERNFENSAIEIVSLNETYKKRVETLYKEYEGIIEEIRLYSTAKRQAEERKETCLRERGLKGVQLEVLSGLINEHESYIQRCLAIEDRRSEAIRREKDEVEELGKKLRLFWSK